MVMDAGEADYLEALLSIIFGVFNSTEWLPKLAVFCDVFVP